MNQVQKRRYIISIRNSHKLHRFHSIPVANLKKETLADMIPIQGKHSINQEQLERSRERALDNNRLVIENNRLTRNWSRSH